MNLYATYLFSPGSQIASWSIDAEAGRANFETSFPPILLKYKFLFLLGLKHANAASSVDVRLEESLYNTRRRFEDLQSSIFAKEQRQKHHK